MSILIACVGDIHGQLDTMYDQIQEWEVVHQKEIDLVLQVGDFEAIAEPQDYAFYYAPSRRHTPGNFAHYASGLKVAPKLTIFTGGNHEPWGRLSQHEKGGFLCENIYYLGRSGIFDFRGIQIAGITGLYSSRYFSRPLSAKPNDNWKYYRATDIRHLKQQESIDILLTHEWVRPFSKYEVQEEQRIPPGFKENPSITPSLEIIEQFKPSFVFMGHMEANVHAKIGRTHLYGLADVSNHTGLQSLKVIEIPNEQLHQE